jgi:hypothetical protein
VGYNMSQDHSEFFIPADKVASAVEAIQDLHGHETIKDGSGRHFSWVDADFYTHDNPGLILQAWRWESEFDDDMNLVGLQFEGQNLGDDNILFEAIAPFVKAGSYIEMNGEDGEKWRWIFDGKTMVEKTATVSWD